MIYSIDMVVHHSFCNSKSVLSDLAVNAIAQDCVTETFGILGVAQHDLIKSKNLGWVTAKSKYCVLRRPKWAEKLRVICQPEELTPVRVFFGTYIYGEDGGLCIYNRKESCVIDRATRRPVPMEQIPEFYPALCEKANCSLSFERFNRNEALQQYVGSVKIRSTNIDSMRHTNNVEYSRLLFDKLSIEELTEKDIESYECHFLSQTFYGDELKIYRLDEDDDTVFSFYKDDIRVFESKMHRK